MKISRTDFVSALDTPLQRLLVGIAFGILCSLAMILLRGVVNLWAPTSGPFALVYPTILIATLYGRWQAGLVSYVICFLWAWWLVLPHSHSFQFEVATDPSRVAINAFSAMIVVILAEAWRRAVREAAVARDLEIERRDMLMAELEHRTKNNFALVASLLSLQRRRLDNAEASAALDEAIGRVSTFASAYENLTAEQGEGVQVSMKHYLSEVVRRIVSGVFDDTVKVTATIEDCPMPRQTAVAIGLFTNEALTNAAKYAFPDGNTGSIELSFTSDGDGWRLMIRDNGIGDAGSTQMHRQGSARPGLGAGLMKAFAQQAEADHDVIIEETGRTVTLIRSAA